MSAVGTANSWRALGAWRRSTRSILSEFGIEASGPRLHWIVTGLRVRRTERAADDECQVGDVVTMTWGIRQVVTGAR